MSIFYAGVRLILISYSWMANRLHHEIYLDFVIYPLCKERVDCRAMKYRPLLQWAEAVLQFLLIQRRFSRTWVVSCITIVIIENYNQKTDNNLLIWKALLQRKRGNITYTNKRMKAVYISNHPTGYCVSFHRAATQLLFVISNLPIKARFPHLKAE